MNVVHKKFALWGGYYYDFLYIFAKYFIKDRLRILRQICGKQSF